MQTNTFTQKKSLIIEIIVLVIFLGALYYAYTLFSVKETEVSQSKVNEQLLGQNFTLFLKVVNQDGLSFKDISVMDGDLVNNLQDFSQVIGETESRGRDNPFASYAPTRSTR